jgi:hypothetical protein
MAQARTLHPRQRAATPRSGTACPLRVMIYSADENRAAELERDLDGYLIQVARSTRTLVTALALDPPPRPQVLVIEIDPLTPIELLELHRLRDNGWFGTIIALGAVPDSLRRSLQVEIIFPRAPAPALLRETISNLPFEAQTTRLPVIRG